MSSGRFGIKILKAEERAFISDTIIDTLLSVPIPSSRTANDCVPEIIINVSINRTLSSHYQPIIIGKGKQQKHAIQTLSVDIVVSKRDL